MTRKTANREKAVIPKRRNKCKAKRFILKPPQIQSGVWGVVKILRKRNSQKQHCTSAHATPQHFIEINVQRIGVY
jgi:hypothetical protein